MIDFILEGFLYCFVYICGSFGGGDVFLWDLLYLGLLWEDMLDEFCD